MGAGVAAAAVLLGVAGAAKLRTPGPAATLIAAGFHGARARRLDRATREIHARRVARTAGGLELAAGSAALVVGDRVAVSLLAVGYLIVTAVAVRLATGPRRIACGCFGAADGVVGTAHVVVDLSCLAVAGWAVAQPPGPVTGLFGDGPLVGVAVSTQALLLAALGYLSITALPALAAARRAVAGSS